jgi:hypothetical protein
MKSWIRLFKLARNIDSFIAAAAGFYLIHILTHHSGVGISPDSVTYLSVTRNLHAGQGFTAFDRMPMVQFPVFYPIFLEIILFFTRMDPFVFAPLLNGILFALLIYCSGALMNGFHSPSTAYKRIILSIFVLSPCLLEAYSMLWSETLFLLLTLGFILAFEFDFRARSFKSFLLLSAITSIACITRYAGIALIGAGGLLLITDSRMRPLIRILRTTLFCLLSYSLLAINLLRNLHLSGTFTGVRQKGTTSLIRNISYYGNTLCDWLPLGKDHYFLSVLTALAILGLFAFQFIKRTFRRSDQPSYEHIACTFGLVYSGFIIFSATITRYQQLDSRLLSPLFIPLVWSLSHWFIPLANRLPVYWRIGTLSLGILLAIGFQVNQLQADFETYDGVKDAGVPGYTEDPWPQSPIVDYIKKNSKSFLPGYTIYSNAGDAVYFFTGLPSDLLPEKVFPLEIKQYYEEEQQYLVWFNEVDNPDMLSLKEILDHKKLTCIAQLEDGAVYIYPAPNPKKP